MITITTTIRRNLTIILLFLIFKKYLFLLLQRVVYFRTVMVEKLCQRNKWYIWYLLTKGTISQMNKYSCKILFIKLFELQYFIFVLQLPCTFPLLLKSIQIQKSSTLDSLINKTIQLFLRPKTSYITFLRKSINHLIPRILFIFLMQQK